MKTLAQFSIFFLSFSYIFFGCRKQELRELDSSASIFPYSCLNGVLDSTAFGVDCGGICQECNLVIPCDNQENRATISGTNSLVFANHYIQQSGALRTISGAVPNGYLIFRFDGTDIETRTHEIIGPNPLENKLGFEYAYLNSQFTTQSGSVYVNYNGEEISLDICELVVSSPVSGIRIISGNVTVDI